jgi:quercetin dioxygenase-like cupin family protein
MEIETWDDAWGQLSESSMKRRLEAQGFVVSRYVYPPGTRFGDHKHGVDKKDAVLKGRFLIRAVGRDFLLGPGDALSVPAGTIHSAEVVGGEEVVSLDAVKHDYGCP